MPRVAAARRRQARPPHLQLDVLVYPDDRRWAAHCLQLDLVEYGRLPETALADVLAVIRAHIEYAIEHDNMAYLFHPAPADVWKQFLHAERTGSTTIRITGPREVFRAPLVVTVQEASVRSLAA